VKGFFISMPDNQTDKELIMAGYEDFMRKVSNNVKRKRMESGKTIEDVAFEGLGQNSTSFYSHAENLKNNKHFNLKHLYLLAEYFECEPDEFLK